MQQFLRYGDEEHRSVSSPEAISGQVNSSTRSESRLPVKQLMHLFKRPVCFPRPVAARNYVGSVALNPWINFSSSHIYQEKFQRYTEVCIGNTSFAAFSCVCRLRWLFIMASVDGRVHSQTFENINMHKSTHGPHANVRLSQSPGGPLARPSLEPSTPGVA